MVLVFFGNLCDSSTPLVKQHVCGESGHKISKINNSSVNSLKNEENGGSPVVCTLHGQAGVEEV